MEEPGRDTSKFDSLMPTMVKPVTRDTYTDSDQVPFEVGIVRQFTFSSGEYGVKTQIITQCGLSLLFILLCDLYTQVVTIHVFMWSVTCSVYIPHGFVYCDLLPVEMCILHYQDSREWAYSPGCWELIIWTSILKGHQKKLCLSAVKRQVGLLG